jgi:hypothetical protein
MNGFAIVITPPTSKPEHTDITGRIGQMFQSDMAEPEFPMFSYSRPSSILWQAMFDGLRAKGWSEAKALEWLQSKGPRWELDGSLGDALEELGKQWAEKIARDYAE